MNVFGFPVRVDDRLPKDMAFIVPDDVMTAIDLCEAAATMVNHGILTEQFYKELLSSTLSFIRQSVRDKRTVTMKL